MTATYQPGVPYKPVSYEKRDACRHNGPRNESARSAFQSADSITISYLELGKGAVFVLYRNSQDSRMIMTSPVREITCDEQGILHVTTDNSLYTLAPA